MIEELQEVEPDDICVSSVTYAELVHGVEKSASVEKNRLVYPLSSSGEANEAFAQQNAQSIVAWKWN